VRKSTEDRAAGLNIGESGSTSALYCGFLRFLAIDFSFLIFSYVLLDWCKVMTSSFFFGEAWKYLQLAKRQFLT